MSDKDVDIIGSLDAPSIDAPPVDIIGSLDERVPAAPGATGALVQTGTLSALVQTGTLSALVQTGTL